MSLQKDMIPDYVRNAGFLTPAARGEKNARRASKKCPPGFEGKRVIVNVVFLP